MGHYIEGLSWPRNDVFPWLDYWSFMIIKWYTQYQWCGLWLNILVRVGIPHLSLFRDQRTPDKYSGIRGKMLHHLYVLAWMIINIRSLETTRPQETHHIFLIADVIKDSLSYEWDRSFWCLPLRLLADRVVELLYPYLSVYSVLSENNIQD